MKRNIIVLLAVLCLVAAIPARAGGPAGASQVAIGFTGGSTWHSASTGTCIWYFPVVGDLELESLFETNSSGVPLVDRAHSYLIWVSDFSVDVLAPPTSGSLFLALAPAGTATIYFSETPGTRYFLGDLSNRSTWGVPVATFVRKASLVRSDDGLASDTFIFSAKLVQSRPFSLNGRHFNFRDLIPDGMTCFESGQGFSSWEAGTCIATGK